MDKRKLTGLHKKIHKYNKSKALSFEAELGEELVIYRKDQEKFSKRNFRASNTKNLSNSLDESKIIYLGDFHTFDQSARNVLRILKTLKKNNPDTHFYLGLEMVHFHKQIHIDNYVLGLITEFEFLDSINYSDSWRFPWVHYSPLFDWAKDEGVKLIALNSTGSLSQRDQFASEIISSFVNNDYDAKFLVMFGEYHIVPNKLPAEVQRRLDDIETKITIIHQNLDEVYWKQVTKNLKKSKIIKFNDDEFSLQNSLPWLKYESMIYWYENLSDDPEFDFHNYLMEEGVKTFGENIEENFIFVCKESIEILGLRKFINIDLLSDYNLYDHTKFNFVASLINKKVPQKLKSFNEYLLQRNKVFKIDFKNNYYCPSYSANRLAYITGLHLASCLERTNSLSMTSFEKMNSEEKFYTLFQRFFLAYMTTKIFNPHRKNNLYFDFKILMKSKSTSQKEKERFRKLLAIIDSKSQFHKQLIGSKLTEIFELARLVAHFMGEVYFLKASNESNQTFHKVLPSEKLNREKFMEFKNYLFPDKSYKMKRKHPI